MSQDTPWFFMKSFKADDDAPPVIPQTSAPPPEPAPPVPPAPSAPVSTSSNGYLDTDINLSRAADVFLGSGMMSYTTREMMDPSNPRTTIANTVASNITNDILDGLKYYMKIEHTDPIVRTMIQLQKMLAQRYFESPLKPYARFEMRYRLGNQPVTKESKKRSRSGKLRALKIGDDGVIEVDPGEALNDTAEREMETDSSSEEENEPPMLTAEESIAQIERRSRKVGEIKHIARQNINVWVYNKMFTRSFLTYVGGSIGYDTLNGLCRVDIPETILNIYLDKTREKFEKSTFDDLENFGLYSIEQTDAFIKSLSPEGSKAENSVLEYIKKDSTNPIQCYNELVIATLLSSTKSAWNLVQEFLSLLREKNPHAPGFITYRPYNDKNGIPDFRMMIKPLPIGTNDHAQVEFGRLIQLFQLDIKNFTLSKDDTRYQSQQLDIKRSDVIRALFHRLEFIGFTGMIDILPI